jgi:hypothetical protein
MKGMELPAFRERKNPCWTILDCSRYVYQKCPAYRFVEGPVGRMPLHKMKSCWD